MRTKKKHDTVDPRVLKAWNDCRHFARRNIKLLVDVDPAGRQVSVGFTYVLGDRPMAGEAMLEEISVVPPGSAQCRVFNSSGAQHASVPVRLPVGVAVRVSCFRTDFADPVFLFIASNAVPEALRVDFADVVAPVALPHDVRQLEDELQSVKGSLGEAEDNASTQRAEIARLRKGVQQFMAATANKSQVETMISALQKKANNSDLQMIRTTVDKKADYSDVQRFMATKADESQVFTIKTALQTKASNSDLQTLRATMDTKASDSQLQALASAINSLSGKWVIAGMFMTYGATGETFGTCRDVDTTGMCKCPLGTQHYRPHTGDRSDGVERLNLCLTPVPHLFEASARPF